MISARGVVSTYGHTRVLDAVSLDLQAGECVGLCGAAGSGKTTLLRVLAGFLKPQAGSIHLRGDEHPADPVHLRRRVSYVAADAMVASGLRVDEYLRFIADLRSSQSLVQAPTLSVLARDVGLDPAAAAAALPPRGRAALALAAGMVTHSGVVLVDEAVDALAPEQRDHAMAWLSAARARGAALLIATDDVELQNALCGRVLQLQNGRLDELRRQERAADSRTRHDARPSGIL